MSGKFALRPRARQDLDAIWEYTVLRWGEDQAEAYIGEIWTGVRTVAADPRRGTPIDDVRVGYRKYHAGSHMLLYRQSGKGVDIVRILHERMDFERHLR